MFHSNNKLQIELIAKQSDLIKELKEQIKYQQEIIAVLKEYHTTMDKLYDHQSSTIKDLISRIDNPLKCAYCGA